MRSAEAWPSSLATQGSTWAIPGQLLDAKVTGLVASRDDPRVAYASGSSGNAAGFWQTVDGGLTWAARTVPPPGYVRSRRLDRAGPSRLGLHGLHAAGCP